MGGAAGSRGADVIVRNQGSAPCVLPMEPTIAIVDPAGNAVLQSPPALGASGPTIQPTGSASFSFEFSNWCQPSVNLPLHALLVLASGSVAVGGLSAVTQDDLPPCNGPGQPASLSTTGWEFR
jgi:hypothetical protein